LVLVKARELSPLTVEGSGRTASGFSSGRDPCVEAFWLRVPLVTEGTADAAGTVVSAFFESENGSDASGLCAVSSVKFRMLGHIQPSSKISWIGVGSRCEGCRQTVMLE
jgi:hypothetical protein